MRDWQWKGTEAQSLSRGCGASHSYTHDKTHDPAPGLQQINRLYVHTHTVKNLEDFELVGNLEGFCIIFYLIWFQTLIVWSFNTQEKTLWGYNTFSLRILWAIDWGNGSAHSTAWHLHLFQAVLERLECPFMSRWLEEPEMKTGSECPFAFKRLQHLCSTCWIIKDATLSVSSTDTTWRWILM